MNVDYVIDQAKVAQTYKVCSFISCFLCVVRFWRRCEKIVSVGVGEQRVGVLNPFHVHQRRQLVAMMCMRLFDVSIIRKC